MMDKAPPNWRPQWRKGESGNPVGTPVKKSKDLAQKILFSTQNGEMLVRRLVALAQGEIEGARPSDQIRAIELLMERAFGKATQLIEVEGEIVHRAINDFSDDELRALVDLRHRIIEGKVSPIEEDITPHLDDFIDGRD
tara:strand:+ start:140 stop:556 length:417 start_codon:yes stop_codon:yes gene_type:complete